MTCCGLSVFAPRYNNERKKNSVNTRLLGVQCQCRGTTFQLSSPFLHAPFQAAGPSYLLRAFDSIRRSQSQFSSVSQSCLTLCNPMDCSTPGFLILHYLLSLLKLMSIESVMPSNHLIPFSSCLQSFPASGSFLRNWFFASVAKLLELQLKHQSFQ